MILFKGSERTILIFYTLAIIISLFMATWSFQTGFKAVEGGEKPETAGMFFFYIILFTLLFLFLIYLIKQWIKTLIFLLELFFLFVTGATLFSVINDLSGLIWGLLLVLLRLFFPNILFFRNLSVAIIAGVSAGLIGASLSPITALILYILLVIYDFTSVFLTKHMIKLAESVENVAKKGNFVALGAGDLVLPSVFATSFIFNYPIAVASSIGAILGIVLAFYCLKKFRRPLPALPYISAVQLSITAVSLFLSTLLP